MEESPKGQKFGAVSFAASLSLFPMTSDKIKKRGISSCCYNFDAPQSPIQAMEFLSRSWSPSSSNYFHILSSNKVLLTGDDVNAEDEKKEIKRGLKADALNREGSKISRDHKWKLSTWEFISTLIPGRRRQKHKEEARLCVAEIHAALYVTQLAAAVASFASGSSSPHLDSGCCDGVVSECWSKNISQAMASAAALVATVCAEAAESAGASRSHIASAMTTGLSIQSTSDIHTLTATAATCLRGAAQLRLRGTEGKCALENEDMLKRGANLPICSHSGKIQRLGVSVRVKHEQLLLRLGKKYLQGAITRQKEYRIIDVNGDGEERSPDQDALGFYFLTLGTSQGMIQILFEDEKQYKAWKFSISQFLLEN